MATNSYRDLIVWQRAVDLATNVYRVGRAMRWNDRVLATELQRSAISIPSNVAEGWARGPGRSYGHHLRIALGSEAELQTQLEVGTRAGVIEVATSQTLLASASEVGRMLHGLRVSVSRRRSLTPDS